MLRIAFDFGGTLVPIIRYQMDRMLEEILVSELDGHDARKVSRAFEVREDEYWSTDAKQRLDLPDHVGLLMVASKDASVALPGGLAHEIMAVLRQRFIDEVPPRPATPSVIASVSGNWGPLGLLSNWLFPGEWLEAWLRRNDLQRYFQCVVSSADVGVRKPNPAIFGLVARGLEIAEPHQLAFVGDNYQEDILGALAYGCGFGCWVDLDGVAPGSLASRVVRATDIRFVPSAIRRGARAEFGDVPAAGGILAPLGIPGAGKSTLANVLVDAGIVDAEAVVSTDGLRLLGAHQGSEEALFSEADRRVHAAVVEFGIAYLDATNLAPARLEALKRLAQDLGVPLVFIRMSTPMDVAMERRRATGTDVPSQSIAELVGWSQTLDEGGLPGQVLSSDAVLKDPAILRQFLVVDVGVK